MTIAQKRAFLTNILFVSVLFVILYLAYRYLLVWILPFVLGFLIAYLLRKPAVFLSRVTRIPQKGTAVILLMLFYLTIGVLLWFSGMKLLLFLGDFFRNLPDFYKNNVEPAIAAGCLQGLLYPAFPGENRRRGGFFQRLDDRRV